MALQLMGRHVGQQALQALAAATDVHRRNTLHFAAVSGGLVVVAGLRGVGVWGHRHCRRLQQRLTYIGATPCTLLQHQVRLETL
jgi:hypothetical protein